jgi:hypothetical protein
MLRFARAPDGALGFDVRARLPGRGAWTCASSSCVRRAVEKGGFERAFEAPVLGKPDDVVTTVQATLESEVKQGLGLLRRASRLAAGRDDVARALAEGRVTALVLANDLSERTLREVKERAAALPVVTGPSQADVGHAIGRKPTGVLGLLGGPRSDVLWNDLRRLESWPRPPSPAAPTPAPRTPEKPAAT